VISNLRTRECSYDFCWIERRTTLAASNWRHKYRTFRSKYDESDYADDYSAASWPVGTIAQRFDITETAANAAVQIEVPLILLGSGLAGIGDHWKSE